ncbi:type IV secretion system protein [Lysinibacillus xylanilyticus]|uniref:type IV secretion system protein n=1 Tax=Lysinibacillus xylanilyticus TaxID=582475 RepID=UPI002B255673|nr:type IV secretion system protein [Lysinibacillus xylanilyticus]MEB2301602.1 type IV secretion system protein [Lysinibacillus xylanilyticus]
MGTISDKIVDIFSKLIEAIFDFILEPFLGLSELKDLVFGNSEEASFIWYTFTKEVYNNALYPLYTSMQVMAIIILVALIVFFGIKTAMNFHKPQGRVEFIQTAFLIFIVVFLFNTLDIFYEMFFNLNHLIVQWFGVSYEDTIATVKDVDTKIGNAIGRILVEVVLVGLSVWANFYYLMRSVTLVLLLSLGPIFIVLLVNPRLRNLTSNWFRETLSTIFVQSIHALVYFILSIFSTATDNIIIAVLTILIFIPTTVAVRGLFGLNLGTQDSLSKAGAALGMTTLFAMGGAVKGAMNGKGISEIARDAMDGVKGQFQRGSGANQPGAMGDIKDTVAGNENSDLAAERKAERLLRNGEVLKAIGKGVFGAAGALAGGATGPMGAFAGAGIASAIGGEVAGFAGRTGTSVMDSLKDRRDKMNKLLDPQSLEEPTLSDDIEASADEIAEVEAHEWANQNRETLLNDLKSRFPDATQEDLESMLEQEVVTRKAELKSHYIDELSRAVSYGDTHAASGESFKNQTTANLLQEWENENRSSFNKEYEQQHPRQENESLEAFEQRRDAEFSHRKAGVANRLQKVVGEAMAGATNELGDVNKAVFHSKLSEGLQALPQTDSLVSFVNPDATALKSTNDIRPASGESFKNQATANLLQEWENDNRSTFNKEYEQQHPRKENESLEAFEQRRDAEFSHRKAGVANRLQKVVGEAMAGATNELGDVNKAAFHSKLSSGLQDLAQTDSVSFVNPDATALKSTQNIKAASGESFKNQATTNLMQEWENENRPSFNREYEQQHPRQKNESLEVYNQRRDAKFSQIKVGVADRIQKVVGEAMTGATNELGDVNKAVFHSKLSSGLQGIAQTDSVSFDNPDAIAQKSTHGIQTASIVSPNHRLMSGNVGQILAQKATMQERAKYIDNAIARGNTAEEAVTTWNNDHAEKSLANNVEKYKHVNTAVEKAVSINKSAVQAFQNPKFTDKVRAFAVSTSADASTALSNVASVVNSGANATVEKWVSNKADGIGVLQNVVSSVESGTSGAIGEFSNQAVKTHGSYVQAQDNLTRTAGYVGGIFLGQTGHMLARKLTNKLSPLNEGVQSEINSAQEVIQMAQTTTDSFGNVQAVPGAIRQVVTPDSSYVEVLTKAGDRKVVSRLSGGHAKLKPNEKVYQDLSIQDGMLVPTKRGSSSTYRLSEDGSAIPSDITIQQNPNKLLRQRPNIEGIGSPSNTAIVQPEAYSPSEVAQIAATTSEGTTVKGAIRQVVTPNESFIEVQTQQGLRHRISHKGEGNQSLQQGEVVYQDLAIEDNSYVPEMSRVGSTLTSSYMVDSAGARIARKIPLNDPNLLHSSNAGLQSQIRPTFIKGKEYPAYNQQVDTGQFFTEDLAANDFDNLKVIVENNRKFVVGEKNGSTYRVSPVQTGDARLGHNEVHEVGVSLIGQSLKPDQSITDNVMGSTLHTLDSSKGVLTEQANYSSSHMDDLIISRVLANAMRAKQIRTELNKVRQKQGIV